MSDRTLRQVGFSALLLALATLALITYLSFRDWNDFQAFSAEVERSRDVLEQVRGILDLVLDAETGQRGFLLTGREEYLSPYNTAVQTLPGQLSELEAILRYRSAAEREAYSELRSLITAKMEEVQQTIAARRSSGPDRALAMVLSDRGRRLMNDIRRVSHSLETEANARVRAGVRTRDQNVRKARSLTLGAAVLLTGLVCIGFLALRSSGLQRDVLIEELEQAHRSEREAGELLEATLYSIGDGVVTTDRDGKVRLMNPAAERLTGCSEKDARGKPIESVFSMMDEQTRGFVENPVRRVLRENRAVKLASHALLLSKSGQETLLDHSGAPVHAADGTISGAVMVFRDITERKRGEERVLQAAKLESLGVLAGGIAHDFNNLLHGVIGNASLLKDYVSGPDADAILLGIQTSAERASQLTQQMLAYAGRGRFYVEPVNLSDLIRELLPMLTASIPKQVETRLALHSDLPLIDADRSQIRQLAMNLIINAAEAIEGRHGLVQISTNVGEIDETALSASEAAEDARPGPHVILTVTDNGAGIDETTRRKIFDPFFSTKFTGRGLGLAAVLGIIRGHKGGIQVISAPAGGSTFRVFFPVKTTRVEAAPEVPERLVKGQEKVLVVDDEEVVRETTRRALEAAGYTAVLANDGQAALNILAERPNDFAVVLLDLTMPLLGGAETLPQIRKLCPGVPIVGTSGYGHEEAAQRFGASIDDFIQKPYMPAQLRHKIEAVLRVVERPTT